MSEKFNIRYVVSTNEVFNHFCQILDLDKKKIRDIFFSVGVCDITNYQIESWLKLEDVGRKEMPIHILNKFIEGLYLLHYNNEEQKINL